MCFCFGKEIYLVVVLIVLSFFVCFKENGVVRKEVVEVGYVIVKLELVEILVILVGCIVVFEMLEVCL